LTQFAENFSLMRRESYAGIAHFKDFKAEDEDDDFDEETSTMRRPRSQRS
jgi:hypothetical protein